MIDYLGDGETNEKGQVHVFFELNGQPRTHHGAGPGAWRRRSAWCARKAALGNATQVGAPMPGVISAACGHGRRQAVKAGDVLLSIEAMKMETAHPRRGATARSPK